MARSTGEPCPAAVDAVVERLGGDESLRAWAGGPAELRVDSVAVRRFSHVARVEARSAQAVRRLVVKIPRAVPGRTDKRLVHLGREVEAATALGPAFAGSTGLGVADVVAFYPDVPALVWGEVAGDTLDEMARRATRGLPDAARMEWLEIACHGAGHWLRALQSSTPPAAGHSLDEMLEYVDVRLERISQLGPRGLDAGWRSEVRGVFRDVRASEADLRVARIHGDFSLSNIIFDGRRTVAIDLTRFGVGSIYHDVSRLYHQLGLLLHKPYVRPATVARLRRALLSGYGGPADVAGQPLFQLFLIQHLLTHWLGLLKMSAAPYHVRAFHRWVGYRHKRELDGLVARLRQGAPRTGVRTWLNTTT